MLRKIIHMMDLKFKTSFIILQKKCSLFAVFQLFLFKFFFFNFLKSCFLIKFSNSRFIGYPLQKKTFTNNEIHSLIIYLKNLF